MPDSNDLLAVLIDADNVSPARIEAVLTEVARFGTASVKRIYGDWTKPNLRGWKDAASAHVIQPIQQFDNTTGKNATDSALIIDAMDLLYTGRFRGFCIVSSDSDFTRLAARIREQGITVYGFGERKTPESFRNACDRFTYLEVIDAPKETDAAEPTTQPIAKADQQRLRTDGGLVVALRAAVNTAADESGWANLSPVGSLLRKQRPDFDSRNWGYAKLSDLMRATGLFDVNVQATGTVVVAPKSKAVTRDPAATRIA
ncbi:NYN domain-containing protein [Agromyces sp. CF514]|uniref:NYN domain-containing protein n=1 Tax=Agromyces sp. CF514 TaxID=1881031 RepID=UPI000B819221|nr:NYN domain-containing protein [Agromyces sp. CF514]